MRVLVSGAGISGPTLAYFLAKKPGAHITVLEKSHALLPYGQNIDLEGSALTVIQKMGLLDELRRWNTTEKGTQFIDPNGQPFAPFPVKKGHASPTSEFEILRGDLARILYDSAKDLPNVDFQFSTTIQEVISNDVDNVKVRLSDGKVHQYDLLVAADGQWSRIRKHCFSPPKIIDLGMHAVYCTIPRTDHDNDWWNIYNALGSRIVALRPDPHGTVRAALICMPLNDDQNAAWLAAASSKNDRQTQVDFLRTQFADAGWEAQRILASMGEAPDFYFHSIQQIKMSRWSQGRVICIGDAAHAPTPLTGMGTSLAIIGAYVLAGELSKLGSEGEHPSQAMTAYEEIFRPFVEKCQKLPYFVPGIVHPVTAWKRYLFQCFMSVVSKVAAIPGLLSLVGDRGKGGDGFSLPAYPGLE